MFTFQFITEAIQEQFPDQAESILKGYTRMLAFDAISGNNDRHHYNWGVVVPGHRRHKPYFSPIYDSARALFWNDQESKLEAIKKSPDPNRLPAFIAKYVKNSRPQTGWDGENRPDHFTLIQEIYRNYPDLRSVMSDLCHQQLLQRIRETLNGEFGPLMSPLRREMILHCLERRLYLFKKAISVDS